MAHKSGRILTQPPERGRSPPAARRSVEGCWTIPGSLRRISRCGPGRSAVRRWWYPDAPLFGPCLDTTTKPAVDSLSPRRRSGEGQGEGISKERDNSMERAPLPSPLPARASQGEGPLQQWWVYQDGPLGG